MSEENNSADNFLLKIDQETKERAAAEQLLQENHKQRAQKMFDETAQVIDEYLNALGKRHFGTGNYEIKHTYDQFSTAYWTVYSVEKKDWNTEMRYSGDNKDIDLHEYKLKEGFKVDLVYSAVEEKGALNLFYDGKFTPFSEGSLQDYIAKIHQKGPRELRGYFPV
jgi:hypothetical protein